ncbi:hypothetical protein CVT25_001562 [Psilocybe cyanescens]|uniref:Uncharacterized protein n=1 Tax=Psilocybe cyanescens TaxID=93625 RepID=A0A409WQ09_PSICY|nr:hypothetical protein CVT25_001562 [Psilocybe cyanescens]
MATLVDLPTELVLQILHDECISHRDLYLIGLVSKRLNFIAISFLLELRSVSNLHDSVSLTLGRDSLPPLYYSGFVRVNRSPLKPDKEVLWPPLKPEALIIVAFHISSIREIQCTLPQSFSDLSSLLRHLERLNAFILRLSSVGSLTLHFEGDHRYRHLSSNMFSAIPVQLADVFGEIIRATTARGCKSLRVYNKSYRLQDQYWNLIDDPAASPFKADPVPVHSAPKKTGTVSILSKAKAKVGNTLFRRQHKPSDFRQPNNPTSPYPSSPPTIIGQSCQLQTIHIQTPFALLPRCFPDIRDIIYASINTLTSLTFSYIAFDEQLFDSFLSSLASLFLHTRNAITHLDLRHCQKISPRPLLELLGCFQDRLEHLELDRDLTFLTDDSDTPNGDLHLHELHTLKAPLDWIKYFIKQDLTGPPLLNLSAMTVQCRLPDAPDFTYEVFRPHLDIVLEPIYSRWKNSSYQYQLPRIHVTLDLILDRHRPQQMDADRIVINLQASLSALSNKETVSAGRTLNSKRHNSLAKPRPPRHWDLITKLELSPTYPPVNDMQASTLAQWVTTVFPAVEQVTLPLPYIPRLMPTEEYKSRQIDLSVDASVFLKNALRLGQRNDDSEPLAWKTLVVGPWSLSLELD